MMINISEISKNPKKVKAYLLSHGWKKIEHTLFHLSNISDNTIIHCDNEKIYALSYIIYLDDHAMLHMFEVNKAYEHIGYGKKAMIEIAKKVKSMGYDEIRLSSIDINSNGFYEHMGFKSKKPYRYYANVNDIINHDNKLNI